MTGKKEFICEVCGNKYLKQTCKTRPTSRFCSNECKNKRVGSWVGKGTRLKFQWETATEEEKFKRLEKNYENLVIRRQGCWGWKGNTDHRRGYGRVTYLKRNRSIPAHVASWMIHRGEIPKGMVVCHKCDFKSCSNPDHLFIGTQYENVRDMVYKNRQAKGENCARSKLTEDQVREIKKMILMEMSNVEISKIYDVTPEAISAIKKCKNWKHVNIDLE